MILLTTELAILVDIESIVELWMMIMLIDVNIIFTDDADFTNNDINKQTTLCCCLC